MIHFFFILSILLCLLWPTEANTGLLVQTNNGYVQGTTVYSDNKPINAWLGIPFAQKPVGSLRFKRPQPVQNWSGTLNATQLPNSCLQLFTVTNVSILDAGNPNTPVSEDCLYLNVWSPSPKPTNAPVMFWIHGGALVVGSSTLDLYDPKTLVAQSNVVFVSTQYRLSTFGFLYLNSTDVPGNMGLLDQNMALQWVKQNIQSFGGDPNRVTVFGESAGAESASLHLLSPLSRDLFQNAILQSGSCASSSAYIDSTTAAKTSIAALNYAGCPGTDVAQLTACARQMDANTLLTKTSTYLNNVAFGNYYFSPTVDGYFLLDDPKKLLSRGEFKKCPIIFGLNKNEGTIFLADKFPEYQQFSDKPRLDYDKFVSYLMAIVPFYPSFPQNTSSQAYANMIYQYTNWANVQNVDANFDNLDQALSDNQYLCPMILLADAYVKYNQSVYMYYYTQYTDYGFPSWFGVQHGHEIPFVFGAPFTESYYSIRERILSAKMIQYWTNFARSQNPNQDSSWSQLFCIRCWFSNFFYELSTATLDSWPQYRLINSSSSNDRQRAYLELNARGNSVGYNLRSSYCAFWNTLMPFLYN